MMYNSYSNRKKEATDRKIRTQYCFSVYSKYRAEKKRGSWQNHYAYSIRMMLLLDAQLWYVRRYTDSSNKFKFHSLYTEPDIKRIAEILRKVIYLLTAAEMKKWTIGQ